MPDPTCLSINVFLSFQDGIDNQFMVSVALFRRGGLTTMVGEADLNGTVPDNFTATLLLSLYDHTFTQADIDGSILYMDHKQRPDAGGGILGIGSPGNDNCNGTATVLFIFSDGSSFQTSQWMPFAIGNNHVSRDTQMAISHPAQTQAVGPGNQGVNRHPHPLPPRPPHGFIP